MKNSKEITMANITSLSNVWVKDLNYLQDCEKVIRKLIYSHGKQLIIPKNIIAINNYNVSFNLDFNVQYSIGKDNSDNYPIILHVNYNNCNIYVSVKNNARVCDVVIKHSSLGVDGTSSNQIHEFTIAKNSLDAFEIMKFDQILKNIF